MKAVFITSAVVVLLLALSLPQSEACHCLPRHEQQMMCESDVVLKVNILFSWITPGINDNNYYIVQIQQIYRDASTGFSYSVGSMAIVETCGNSACCGFNGMNNGETWVLSGSVDAITGFISISSCGYNTAWNSLSKQEKKNIKKYTNNCDCQMVFCRNCKAESCSNADSSNVCKFTYSVNDNVCRQQCYRDYSYCWQNGGGQCGWNSNKNLKKCLAGCGFGCPLYLNDVASSKVAATE